MIKMNKTDMETELKTVSDKQKLLLKEILDDDDDNDRTHRWIRLAMMLNSVPGAKKTPPDWRSLWIFYKASCERDENDGDVRRRGQHKATTPLGWVKNNESTKSCTQYAKLHPVKQVPIQRSLKDENIIRRMILLTAGQPNKELKENVLTHLTTETSFDCKRIWQHLQSETKDKIKWLLCAQDCPYNLPISRRMSITDWLFFDMVLVHDEIDVTGVTIYSKEVSSILVNLFELVRKYNIEKLKGDQLAEAWSLAAKDYNKETRTVTPMLLQKRWYQMKKTTRTIYYEYAAICVQENVPTPLQVAIAKQFPEVWTLPWPSWEQLIENERVILRERFDQISLKETINNNVITTVVHHPEKTKTVDLDRDSDSTTKGDITISELDQSSHSLFIVKEEDSDTKMEEIAIKEEVLIKPELLDNGDSIAEDQTTEVTYNSNPISDEPNKTIEETKVKKENETIEIKEEDVEINCNIEDNEKNDTELTLPKITNIFGNVKMTQESLSVINQLAYQLSLKPNNGVPNISKGFLEPNTGSLPKNIVQVTSMVKEHGVEKKTIGGVSRLYQNLDTPPKDHESKRIEKPPVLTLEALLNDKTNRLLANISEAKSSTQSQFCKLITLPHNNVKFKGKTYDLVKLHKNPDFNLDLKKLSENFFQSARNRKLLAACKRLTVDIDKLQPPTNNAVWNYQISGKNSRKGRRRPNRPEIGTKPTFQYCRIAPKPTTVTHINKLHKVCNKVMNMANPLVKNNQSNSGTTINPLPKENVIRTNEINKNGSWAKESTLYAPEKQQSLPEHICKNNQVECCYSKELQLYKINPCPSKVDKSLNDIPTPSNMPILNQLLANCSRESDNVADNRFYPPIKTEIPDSDYQNMFKMHLIQNNVILKSLKKT